ncbi:hypothetical protein AYO44_06725 [Planctomycetaceae bacterium SCGC AG-212-F19]|nr:hypothetical protein AYO44_06725 [Planctomycetaceae bacterium SCGC AG-212-F19]
MVGRDSKNTPASLLVRWFCFFIGLIYLCMFLFLCTSILIVGGMSYPVQQSTSASSSELLYDYYLTLAMLSVMAINSIALACLVIPAALMASNREKGSKVLRQIGIGSFTLTMILALLCIANYSRLIGESFGRLFAWVATFMLASLPIEMCSWIAARMLCTSQHDGS